MTRADLFKEISDRADEIRSKEPVPRTVRDYLRSIGSAALCDPLSGYAGGSRTSSMLRRSVLECAAHALLGLERSDHLPKDGGA